jgi:hypothetical protein
LPSIRNDSMASQSALRCSARTSITRPSSLHRAHRYIIDLHHNNDASHPSLPLATSATYTVHLPCVSRYFFITTSSGTHDATRPSQCSQHARYSHTALLCRIVATTYRTTTQDTTDPPERVRPNIKTKSRRAQPVQHSPTKQAHP